MKKYLIIDILNILNRCYFVNRDLESDMLIGMVFNTALVMLNRYFRQHKPDKMILAFDDGMSWRKKYTLSENCYSKLVYKGLRNKDMTDSQKEKYDIFKNSIKDFYKLLKENSSIICMSENSLEADDIIAGFVQSFSDDNEIVIISSDKDLLQLLINANVSLIDPNTDEKRTLEEYHNDYRYFIFEKCIRGEKGTQKDNIEQAYPRLRKDKIKLAFDDSYKFEEIMHHTWKHVDGREMEVKKLFIENKLLMDLTNQPDEIKEKIANSIIDGFNNIGSFSFTNFLQFCGTYKLIRVSETYKNFMPMLTH